MTSSADVLSQKSLVVILAYAPTGLGHLRVTDALFHGLPSTVTPLLLGSQDRSIGLLHRITSIHPLGRSLMEWTQRGMVETVFTSIYRRLLNTRADILYSQLSTILDQRITVAKKVLVVSTHFGLAYELSRIKKNLEKEKDIQIILVVVVTDDSPQQLWYVPETDLTFVPSAKTKERLHDLGRRHNLPDIPIKVVPYPISPRLTEMGRTNRLTERKSQVDISHHSQIHICIPISGAAVGLTFFISFIHELHHLSDRIRFHIIIKNVPYTQQFINTLLTLPYVLVHSSTHDRELVDIYESVYHQYPITFEITKPSEQAFKALLDPLQIGGAILLFALPVGRQEYDNLAFLRRHKLIPTHYQEQWLFQKYLKKLDFTTHEKQSVLAQTHYWRGLTLPVDSIQAAGFVVWCLNQGIYARMLEFKRQTNQTDSHIDEISPEGVKIFWQKISEYIRQVI